MRALRANDYIWEQFGIRIDTKRTGRRIRFEVECHRDVRAFADDAWLEEQFIKFENLQAEHGEKRRRVVTDEAEKGEAQAFKIVEEWERPKWNVNMYKPYVQRAHDKIRQLEAFVLEARKDAIEQDKHVTSLLKDIEKKKKVICQLGPKRQYDKAARSIPFGGGTPSQNRSNARVVDSVVKKAQEAIHGVT